MKITYHLAASRDGYIAKIDGDVAWLDEFSIDPNESGLVQFFDEIDGLVMGRHTYDFVFNYGTWPYKNRPSWVCTNSEFETMAGANLYGVNRIDDVIVEADTKGLKHLWLVGGGLLASSFLDQGLLTNICVTELPIDLGDGIPMFSKHKLSEISCKTRVANLKKGFRQIEIEI